jgi:hypothetical protein
VDQVADRFAKPLEAAIMNEQNDRPLVPSEDFWNTVMVWVDPRDVDQFIEISRLSRCDDASRHAPQMTVVMHEKPPRLDRAA